MPSLSQIHRPKRFSDVTGQGHITETLKQELITGRLGHVFLFSGPRGVGKTTTARIFAKALNCDSLKNGEPCLTCLSCKQSEEGRVFDVIELDAATNNGVDAVRESIIEHSRFAPAGGKRKVYILDEAHMLSTAAWNALLKTLEEPPAYAFFILATTEWHKVPATILSRSQQFQFRRIEDADMRERLSELVKAEGWTIDSDALGIIVRKADGCLRDAETLLGQVGGLGGKAITKETLGLVLPIGQQEQAAELLQAWGTKSFSDWYALIERYADQGVPFLPLFDELLQCIEELLAAEASASIREEYAKGSPAQRILLQCVGLFSLMQLQMLAIVLFERRRDVKMGLDPIFAMQLVGLTTLKESNSTSSIEPKKVEIEQLASIVKSSPSPIEKTETPVIKQSSNITISQVRNAWQEILRLVEEKNHSLPMVLRTASPHSVEGGNVILKFAYPFHRDRLIGDGKNRGILQDAVRKALKDESLLVEGIVSADIPADKSATDVVGNILQAFGGSVVES